MHVAAAPPKTSREEGCEAMEVAHTVPIACAMGPPASPWLSFQLDAAAVMRCLTQPQPAR